MVSFGTWNEKMEYRKLVYRFSFHAKIGRPSWTCTMFHFIPFVPPLMLRILYCSSVGLLPFFQEWRWKIWIVCVCCCPRTSIQRCFYDDTCYVRTRSWYWNLKDYLKFYRKGTAQSPNFVMKVARNFYCIKFRQKPCFLNKAHST